MTERDDESPQDHDRQSAQAAAGELARMGIDPAVLGLDPAAPPATAGPRPPAPRWSDEDGAAGHRLPAPPPQFADPGRRLHALSGQLAPPPAETALPPGRIASVLSRPLGAIQPPGRRDTGSPEDFRPASAPPAVTPTIVVPGRMHRAVRAVTFGLAQPGAAAAMERERELVARARTRRREGRTVAFIAGKGGVGTTTTALGTALTLAALRTDLTAVVDTRQGAASIGRRLAGRAAPTVTDLRPRAGRGERVEAPAEPMLLDGRLGVIDGPPWFGPPTGRQVVEVLDQLKDRFTFTLADLGNDIDWDGHAALARADRTVLVSSPWPDAAAATRATLARIHRLAPHRLDTIVVAVVCLTARQFRHTAIRLHADLRLDPDRLIPVPFDPYLATGDLLRADRLRPATREAYLRIAGVLAGPRPAARPGGPSPLPAPPPVAPPRPPVTARPVAPGAGNVRGVASVAPPNDPRRPLPPPPGYPGHGGPS
ncbi:hypothetical protein [Actinoplanes sp. HUAS TT8]|uniref:hypothetical protein n=1 Tax=Actinoplanes sp. HUAS TT8 TaxID=3447453 RepID=UPI003F51CD89